MYSKWHLSLISELHFNRYRKSVETDKLTAIIPGKHDFQTDVEHNTPSAFPILPTKQNNPIYC